LKTGSRGWLPARWPALIAGTLGCLTLAVVVASFPLGAIAHQVRGDGIQLLIALTVALLVVRATAGQAATAGEACSRAR
jgi:hypothetical protein